MTSRPRLTRRIASLEKRLAQLKQERRFLRDSYERLRRNAPPPAERPIGPALKVIPKRRLNVGRWYLGIGRGSNVALWAGKGFKFIAEAEMDYQEKSCNHWDDGPPFGCFQPFEEIDHARYGQECRYVEDMKSKAKDRAWRKKWKARWKPVNRDVSEMKAPKRGR